MVKKILVTGGLGFIGTNLVKHLYDNTDCEIVVLDNMFVPCNDILTNFSSNAYGDRELVLNVESVLDYDCCLKNTKDCDAVIHLAAQTSVMFSQKHQIHDLFTNAQGTLNMLKASACNGVENFTYASSVAVLGEQDQPVDESNVPRPLCNYGVSKLTGEGYCNVINNSEEMVVNILRFSNVYGPYSAHTNNVVCLFIKNILNGKYNTIYGDGLATRDMVYVQDVVNALCLSMDYNFKSNNCNLFQIGTGVETTMNYLLRIINSVFELKNKKIVKVKYAPERDGEIRRSYCNINKAVRELGYKPETEMVAGICKTIDWYCDNSERLC